MKTAHLVLGGRLHVVGGLCHSPYAGITQIRFIGVDSVSAALSAWQIQAPPGLYFVFGRKSNPGDGWMSNPIP